VDEKNNKPKPIRAWNLFEVAALYRYVNVMANLKNVTSGCFFFSRGVGGPRLVLPGDVLIFLGYDDKKLIFLHQKNWGSSWLRAWATPLSQTGKCK
jgi:hypothetical protein